MFPGNSVRIVVVPALLIFHWWHYTFHGYHGTVSPNIVCDDHLVYWACVGVTRISKETPRSLTKRQTNYWVQASENGKLSSNEYEHHSRVALRDNWQHPSQTISKNIKNMSVKCKTTMVSCNCSTNLSNTIWLWINTYRYIFSGMNIHLPAILGFTRYQGFDPSPYHVPDKQIWLPSWDIHKKAVLGQLRQGHLFQNLRVKHGNMNGILTYLNLPTKYSHLALRSCS